MNILGIDIGGTRIKYGIGRTPNTSQLIYSDSLSSDASEGKDALLRSLRSLIKYSVERFGVEEVGIGVPGLVNPQTGTVSDPPHIPGWTTVNLYEELQSLGLPILIDNDANCFAMGEYLLRKDTSIKNLVGITLGTGIGGGIVLNGKIFRGKQGGAGEIGHIKVVPHGRECECSQHGCIEAYASDSGIQAISYEHYGRKLCSEELYKLALQGDEKAITIFSDVFEKLGIVCAGIVNLLAPDIIVFGGGLTKMNEFLLKPVKRAMQANCYKKLFEGMKVEISKFGDKSGITGAIKLCI
jgi:glucokinase